MRGIAVSFWSPLILVSTGRIQHACHRQPLSDRRLVLRGLLHGRRLGARSVARRADPVPRLSHGLRDETEPSHEGPTPWIFIPDYARMAGGSVATAALNFSKKSSAVFFAALLMRRWPSWASFPPICDSTL